MNQLLLEHSEPNGRNRLYAQLSVPKVKRGVSSIITAPVFNLRQEYKTIKKLECYSSAGLKLFKQSSQQAPLNHFNQRKERSAGIAVRSCKATNDELWRTVA